MAINRGKQFENIIKEAFERVPGVSIDRVHDQTTGYSGSSNICDFIVYKKPYEYYIECKSVHNNVLPFRNITDIQWKGLLKKSKIDGVVAGIICWWIDRDVTKFIPIQLLQAMKEDCQKRVYYHWTHYFSEERNKNYIMPEIVGKKKRVFFDYDMEKFLNELGRVSK